MATSVLIMMTIVSNDSISNMFDLNYLKIQDKNKFLQFKKQQYEYRHSQTSKRASMLTKHNKNNYNIIKEHKR